LNMEGGPYQEYFYIEIPTSGVNKRRFVYVQEEGNQNSFPMQFGTDVSCYLIYQVIMHK
jgi:hypothetical protein